MLTLAGRVLPLLALACVGRCFLAGETTTKPAEQIAISFRTDISPGFSVPKATETFRDVMPALSYDS
jgi:hypothetical protein